MKGDVVDASHHDSPIGKPPGDGVDFCCKTSTIYSELFAPKRGKMSINLDEINAARAAIVEIAEKMLAGELSYMEGSDSILTLLDSARLHQDGEFLPFAGISSEADRFPKEAARRLWKAEALMDLQPEIEKTERWARAFGEPACRAVIKNMKLVSFENFQST